MAKRTVPPSTPVREQEEEMVVTVVRFRGSGESMRKGFEALSQAFSVFGPGPAVTTHRLGNGRKAAQLVAPASNAVEADAATEEAETETAEETDETPEATTEETAAQAKPKAKPGAPRYSYLPDFNLAPDNAPSLKEYCANKDGDTEENRYLLITSWLQKHGGAEPWTGNHLFTCFRELSPWKGRVDIMAPVRELKSTKSYFAKEERGQWKLTGTGMRAAEAIGTKP